MSLNERVKYLEMKEKYKKKLRPWYKKWWGVLLILLILLIISLSLSSAIYIVKQVKEIRAGKNIELMETEMAKITNAIDGNGEHYSLGPITAKVQIMVFSDYSCPYCRESMPLVYSLAEKYPEEIRITMRDYPALRQESVNLALAAHCAGEQNRFWQMHDKLFEKQDELLNLGINNINPYLKNLALELSLNTANFNQCLDEKKYLYRLNDDFADAEFLGVEGTPTWFINRYKITGLYPEENFINLIEGLLVQ